MSLSALKAKKREQMEVADHQRDRSSVFRGTWTPQLDAPSPQSFVPAGASATTPQRSSGPPPLPPHTLPGFDERIPHSLASRRRAGSAPLRAMSEAPALLAGLCHRQVRPL